MTPKEQAQHARQLARVYIGLGFTIVPLGADKRPVSTGTATNGRRLYFSWEGYAEQRPTEKELAAIFSHDWWSEVRGVAALAGDVSGGLVVLDGDHAPIETARQHLHLLGLPDDYAWFNPSGSGDGWHCYVRCPDWQQDKAKVQRDAIGGGHVELRWRGSYTALPGSVHPSGNIYPGNPVDAPQVVRAAALAAFFEAVTVEASKATPTPSKGTRPAPSVGGTAYGLRALAAAVDAIRTTPEGGRNDRLNAEAKPLGELVGGGELDRAHVEAELTAAALACGLGESETAATLRSALDAGEKEPRRAPDDGGRHSSPSWVGGDVTAADAALIGLDRRTGDAWYHRYQPHEADLCNAFLELHGNDWRFVDKLDIWIGWNGTHWREDESLRLRHDLIALQEEAHAALRDEAEALRDDAGDDKEAQQAAKAAMQTAMQWKPTILRTSAATKQAEAKRAIHRDRLATGNLLNLANGCLDLRTFELRPHRRDDLLTHCLPYAYDADATCPTWERFIREVLVDDKLQPDPELAALAQEAIGYSLTTETNREAFFFLSGNGGNGKSTLIRTVAALLGDDLSMTLDLEALAQYGADYRLAMIRGKRIVFSTEAKPEAKIADGVFRRIASGETLDARPIGKEPVQITPVCKLWWAQNAQPNVHDTSDGFWRRLKLLPFRRQFTEAEKDIDLPAKLLAELPGILNWALDGLRRLRTVGTFTASKQATAAAAEYRTASNPIALWVNECTTLGLPDALRREIDAKRMRLADSDAGWTQARAAYDNYRGWCVDTGRHEANQTVFGRELSAELVRRGAGDKEEKRRVTYYPFGLTAPALPKEAAATAGDAEAIGLTAAAENSPGGGADVLEVLGI